MNIASLLNCWTCSSSMAMDLSRPRGHNTHTRMDNRWATGIHKATLLRRKCKISFCKECRDIRTAILDISRVIWGKSNMHLCHPPLEPTLSFQVQKVFFSLRRLKEQGWLYLSLKKCIHQCIPNPRSLMLIFFSHSLCLKWDAAWKNAIVYWIYVL